MCRPGLDFVCRTCAALLSGKSRQFPLICGGGSKHNACVMPQKPPRLFSIAHNYKLEKMSISDARLSFSRHRAVRLYIHAASHLCASPVRILTRVCPKYPIFVWICLCGVARHYRKCAIILLFVLYFPYFSHGFGRG